MTGFNLPPGCSVSDIPGNRPEDMEAEALVEKISEALLALKVYEHLPEATQMAIEEKVFELCGDTYNEGYKRGQADEALARDEGTKG